MVLLLIMTIVSVIEYTTVIRSDSLFSFGKFCLVLPSIDAYQMFDIHDLINIDVFVVACVVSQVLALVTTRSGLIIVQDSNLI